MKKVVLFIVILLSFNSVKAQFLEGLASVVIKDTVCYKYSFFPGDTLYFQSAGLDSIVIDTQPALTKIRHERVKMWCDSTVGDTAFHISYQMLSATSREKILTNDTIVERYEHPWINKIVSIVIDSTGKRLDYKFGHIKRAVVAPGGTFQPILLLLLGESCHKENSTWLVKDTYGTPENGAPMPIIAQSSLMRAEKSLDTLGRLCKSVRFNTTGQTIYKAENDEAYVNVSSRKNYAGYLRLDSVLDLPVNLWCSGQDILTIKNKDESETRGWVYSQVEFTLEKMILSPLRNKPDINNTEIKE
ncbi:MAG: hypothetical protein WCR42_00645 [bacterium]